MATSTATPLQASSLADRQPITIHGNGEHILVVDDQKLIRTMISSALEDSGYFTTTAAGGLDALAYLRTHPRPSLVLSDVTMQGMDGMAMLQILRRDYPDLPAIMVTAVHDIQVAMTAIRGGAYDYLLKPFQRDQLLATVKRALAYSTLLQQNAVHKHNLERLVGLRTDMLRQTMADLERSYDITLEALGDALDLRDTETEGHSKRVTAYTIALARASGMGDSEIRTISRGAFLHDIGKIAIPDSILLKPGALNEDEKATMREHCARGHQILCKIPFLAEASEIVLTHQERFDGSGYPQGLKSTQIPIGSRLFAIADTLDAITSDRPYRKATSFADARLEIARCANTQFDPLIVRRFLELPERLWIDLRQEISSRTLSCPSPELSFAQTFSQTCQTEKR